MVFDESPIAGHGIDWRLTCGRDFQTKKFLGFSFPISPDWGKGWRPLL